MQNFATTAPIAAVLTVPAGRIHLAAADRADTTVEVAPADPGKSRDVQLAEQTTVTYADGVLRVEAPEPGNRVFGPSGSVAVTVHLPAGSRVDVTSNAAELRATGRFGNVRVAGAYRDIHLDEAATLRLTATDGDVEVGRVGGATEITTARGDIRLTEAVSGTVVLRTQAGDITVGAAAGVSATLDAGTGHGRISNALKNNGNPELTIRATTSQGDIAAHSL
ncbi:DUF4097 family beta strand repeat-containing protein [Amycolatopsis sp. ATCC 39116]|uniref:DUF4097 family beta strand repeat-containing protein n=1 Tax=Amycolatopsis sp. (strain ATCC 39116 / 75iv2) TaxID=385957 RepID=UPI000262854E|nr:DUF4097 family beta strand repeat-containing protein [Amycolatopsis sp. ATCC 39116]